MKRLTIRSLRLRANDLGYSLRNVAQYGVKAPPIWQIVPRTTFKTLAEVQAALDKLENSTPPAK